MLCVFHTEALSVTTIQNILELLKKALMHAGNAIDKSKVFDILAELAKSGKREWLALWHK